MTSVTVQMSKEEAEILSNGLSDLLCWCAGFNAALSPPEDHDRRPYGISAARDINIKIKKAIDDAENPRS